MGSEMPEINDYGSAADAIAEASALIEATFLRVGKALEASVKVLTQLIESFEILLTELKSRNLEQALAGLAKAAAEVADIGQTRSTESGFARLKDLAEAI